jgi:hypothetical protein
MRKRASRTKGGGEKLDYAEKEDFLEDVSRI